MTLFLRTRPVMVLKVLSALLLAALCLVVWPQSSLAERVSSLHQDLTLAKNGQLAVEETITVDFGKVGPTTFSRHIATLYKRSGKLCSLAVYVKGVTDGQGQKVFYRSRDQHGWETIQVGEGHSPLSGVHEYKLSYDVINSVNFVSGQPELFYSVLGREFTIPIDKVSLALSLSPGQEAQAARTVGYVGKFGGKKHARTKFGAHTVEIACEKFAPSQDLIVVLPLPAGSITRSALPDALSEIYETSKLAVLLPAGTLALLFLLWLFIGSDQHFGKKPTFTLGAPWQPPRELTPAEIGTVLDESCEDKDVMSTIFDLACRGYLAIRETPNHGAHGYGSKDYEFSQPPQPVSGILKPHEELFINAIFTGRNKVYLSDMQGYLIDYLPMLRKQIMTGLTKDKFFARNPQSDRNYFINCGSSTLALGGALYAYSVLVSDTYQIASYGIFISGLLIVMASGVMPKRTRKGVGAIDQIHAFEHFILHAHEKEIEQAATLDPTVFSRLLPYAMVLGMAEFWAARFKHVIKESPTWYISIEEEVGSARAFDTEVLVENVNAAMKAIILMASSKPEHKAGQPHSSGVSSQYLP